MKKIFKRKSPSEEPQVEADIAVLIGKVQQQLVFLEKKIDTLISQSQERPFEGKRFSKPFQRFDRPNRYDRGSRDGGFQRSFTKVICADCNKECEVPFKPSSDRPVYCKECFSKRNEDRPPRGKYDNSRREGGFSPSRNFDEGQGGEGRRPGRKAMFRRPKGRAKE